MLYMVTFLTGETAEQICYFVSEFCFPVSCAAIWRCWWYSLL